MVRVAVPRASHHQPDRWSRHLGWLHWRSQRARKSGLATRVDAGERDLEASAKQRGHERLHRRRRVARDDGGVGCVRMLLGAPPRHANMRLVGCGARPSLVTQNSNLQMDFHWLLQLPSAVPSLDVSGFSANFSLFVAV